MKSMTTLTGALKHLNFLGFTILTSGFRHIRSKDYDTSMVHLRSYLGLPEEEVYIFSAIFYTYYNQGKRLVDVYDLAQIFNFSPLRILQFQDDIDSLVEKGFLEKNEVTELDQFPIEKYFVPPTVEKSIINNEKIQFAKKDTKEINGFVTASSIKKKDLFYMPEILPEIQKVTSSLEQENFVVLQQRMADKGLSKGICIMFYGEPGTGKTETAYQLARHTGRGLYHIDVGQIRSKWINETDQRLAKLFDDYQKNVDEAKEKGELLPILLFNEADSLFGKRLDTGMGNTLVYENNLQALLLDRMERMEGILIATTNIADRLDAAFERRFLFKIKFGKPNADIKKKIWKNKISWIEDDVAEQLAKDYSFSGGEIDNIVKKLTMDELLSGTRPGIKELESYCKNEKIKKASSNVIGFSAD